MRYSTVVDELRANVVSRGDEPFLFVGERSLTYREMLVSVECVAGGLRSIGVKRGSVVAILAENLPENAVLWFALNALSAVDVPLNTEAKGAFLEYLVRDANVSGFVCSPLHEERVAQLMKSLDRPPAFVCVIGESALEEGDLPAATRLVTYVELLSSEAFADLTPKPSETATVMYTSGTTGPSKGVELPQGYYPGFGDSLAMHIEMGPDNRIYCAQPLFHIDARLALMTALVRGGSAVLGRRFSPSRFWDEIRTSGSDRFFYIGTMLWLLHKRPPSPDDAQQPARIALGSSTPGEIQREFETRFNIELIEAYGMTEGILLLVNHPSETRPGSIGKPAPGVDVRLVDDGDVEVGSGQVGEIVFRPLQPNLVSSGYWSKPGATVEAWRNLWFHTGDLARYDAEGFWYYVARKKDSVRRRGENISAWEIEQAVTRHPAVLEAAAIGLPSELGEEDVAVLVVLSEDAPLDPAELCEFAAADLPYFAVPRYVEVVDSLPKTPSERIAKGEVRERGITDAAWDAERVGWRPKRVEN